MQLAKRPSRSSLRPSQSQPEKMPKRSSLRTSQEKLPSQEKRPSRASFRPSQLEGEKRPSRSSLKGGKATESIRDSVRAVRVQIWPAAAHKAAQGR
eukprot:4056512-Prymnesium_polylepis.1